MICIKLVQKYCCDDISLIENYNKAINDNVVTWACHHRLETDENISRENLIEIGKYYKVTASELIFLTPKDHATLHNNNRSIEIISKISNSMKGNKNPSYGRSGNKHPLYGVHRNVFMK